MLKTDKIGHLNYKEAKIQAIGVSANGLIGAVPDELWQVVIDETGGAGVTINLGTTAGGSQISALYPITANQRTVITVDYSLTTAFNVYISSAAWGTAVLNVYLLLIEI